MSTTNVVNLFRSIEAQQIAIEEQHEFNKVMDIREAQQAREERKLNAHTAKVVTGLVCMVAIAACFVYAVI